MGEIRKQRLLKSAADLIGRDALAARLKVAESLLEAWINGHATLPDRKLIALAEVLDELADTVSSKPKPSSLLERDR
ncbi:MAG TPA: hypothetical protein VFB93_24590 [Burkholderiales bacterium]|nr:hypothetical protein [Burkholderiales bacterium]